jgi:hypothetical protein
MAGIDSVEGCDRPACLEFRTKGLTSLSDFERELRLAEIGEE